MMRKILILFLISCFTAFGVHGGKDNAVDKTGIFENSATQTTSQIDTVSKVDEVAEESITVCEDENLQSSCAPALTEEPECNKNDIGCGKINTATESDCPVSAQNSCGTAESAEICRSDDCNEVLPDNDIYCDQNNDCSAADKDSGCGRYTIGAKDGFLSIIADFIKSGEAKENVSSNQNESSYNSTPVSSEERNQVYELVNAERSKNGLPSLAYRQDLQAAADLRAREIVQLFSHTRPNGKSCFTAVTDAGISYKALGENIAYGQRSPDTVMNGWMNSSGHRANILSSNYTGIAVGYFEQNGVKYWVQIFIK